MTPNVSKNIKDANDKVVLGLIGCGGRGTSLILDFQKNCRGVEVKYICDVDAARGGRAIKELGQGQGYEPLRVKDMRRVYDDKDVDAVVIATPEHWHALAGPTHLNSRVPDLTQATVARFCNIEPQFLFRMIRVTRVSHFAKTEGHRNVTYSQLCDFAVLQAFL